MKCKTCNAPLPAKGQMKHDRAGVYIERVCTCGRIYKTRFGKQPPANLIKIPKSQSGN